MPIANPSVTPNLALWLDGSATAYSDSGGTTTATAPAGRVRRTDQPSPLSGAWLASSDAVRPYRDASALWLDGLSQTIARPTGITLPANDCTIAFRLRTGVTHGAEQILVGSDGSGAWGPALGSGVDYTHAAILTFRQNGIVSTGLSVPQNTDVTILQTYTAAGVRTVLSVAGVQTTNTGAVTISTRTVTSILLGSGNASFFNGSIYQVVATSAALAAGGADEQDLIAWLDGVTGAAGYPTGCPLVVVAGDSIPFGFTLQVNQSWAGRMSGALSTDGYAHRWAQTAIPGYTVAQMQSDYASRVTPLYSSSRAKNILIAAAATNSMYFGTDTAAQVIAAYWAYCDAARAAGWRVVACTVLPRTDATGGNRMATYEADRATFNAAIVAGWASHANALGDAASVSGMGAAGDSDNATNYADKVHPSSVGAGLLAPTYTAAVEAILTTPPTLSSPTAIATGQTTADLGVTTNENNGTLYAVVTTNNTAPTPTQVKAGQTHTGSAAAFDDSQAISSAGAKTFIASGLTAGTTYYAHFMHEDAATNQSAVVSSASFTTDAMLGTAGGAFLFSGFNFGFGF